MTKKKGLGRGLSALLEDPSTDITTRNEAMNAPPRSAGPIGTILIAQIEPNPFQPRTHFSDEALAELAQSISELGIIQPVTVRKVGYDRYQLISGERRFRASQLAGLAEVPAYIRIANDEAMLEMALVENIQREELDAIEAGDPDDLSDAHSDSARLIAIANHDEERAWFASLACGEPAALAVLEKHQPRLGELAKRAVGVKAAAARRDQLARVWTVIGRIEQRVRDAVDYRYRTDPRRAEYKAYETPSERKRKAERKAERPKKAAAKKAAKAAAEAEKKAAKAAKKKKG